MNNKSFWFRQGPKYKKQEQDHLTILRQKQKRSRSEQPMFFQNRDKLRQPEISVLIRKNNQKRIVHGQAYKYRASSLRKVQSLDGNEKLNQKSDRDFRFSLCNVKNKTSIGRKENEKVIDIIHSRKNSRTNRRSRRNFPILEDTLMPSPTMDLNIFNKNKEENIFLEIKQAPRTAIDSSRKYKRAQKILNFISPALTPSSLPKKDQITQRSKKRPDSRPWSPDKNEVVSFEMSQDIDLYLETSN